MSGSTRGYYINGLLERRSKLLKEHRQLMARYGHMERMGHPSTRDQGLMIDLNKQFITMLDAALAEAKASTTPSDKENAG